MLVLFCCLVACSQGASSWAAQEAWAGFAALGEEGLASGLLRRLTLGPAARGMGAPLQALQGFCDWEEAAELGRIVPRPGADANFDAAVEQVGLEKTHAHRVP